MIFLVLLTISHGCFRRVPSSPRICSMGEMAGSSNRANNGLQQSVGWPQLWPHAAAAAAMIPGDFTRMQRGAIAVWSALPLPRLPRRWPRWGCGPRALWLGNQEPTTSLHLDGTSQWCSGQQRQVPLQQQSKFIPMGQ